MLKRSIEILVVVIILGAMAIFVLPLIRMTYVPTPANISQHTRVTPFQVKPTAIKGIYGNHDIDSLVFRYTTGAVNQATLTTAIDTKAIAAGWTRLPNKAGSTCYQRIRRGQTYWGAEEVRVQFDPKTKRVTVGWAQGDSFKQVASFSETSESDWADSEVWPKMSHP